MKIKISTYSLILFCLLSSIHSVFAKDYKVSSPNGDIVISINTNKGIQWSAMVNGQQIFENNSIDLVIDGKSMSEFAKVRKAINSSFSGDVEPIVAVKSKMISNNYNQLYIRFNNKFAVIFRVFNNGVAYQFETFKKGNIKVTDEKMTLSFAGNYSVLFPEEETVMSHYERLYVNDKLSNIENGKFASLPTLVSASNNIKIGITEANLYDYPNLFVEATGGLSFKSKFPKVLLESKEVSDRNVKIVREGDYIAETKGTRTFPWRVFMLSTEDRELVENEMVYLLSDACKLKDTSWIKPGLVAWDWWNYNNLFGVDFKSGINNTTYKYYIDFASKYKIPYIILDEGWSKTTTNVMEPNPDINIPELVKYGKERNVELILWSLWGPLDKNMEGILDQFEAWGVKGLKVDFMAQGNQSMVNFYERTAKACADRKMLVDFHGAYKPAGLRRAYPNVINYEGLKGLENNKWSDIITPEHDVTLPFTRMLAGPMDFTPGSMRNAHKKDYGISFNNPMSFGTRCHQLAMYVVYDAPLQMLADTPSMYYSNEESTAFISKMKTVWDETKVLDAKVGDYILTARKSGNDWFIGAMTDDTARNLELDFSFLEEGNYEIEIMQDGINADKAAVDYKRVIKKINKNSKITIQMVSGGGWAAICKKI